MERLIFDFKRGIAAVTGTPEGDKLYAEIMATSVKPRRTAGYVIRLKFKPV